MAVHVKTLTAPPANDGAKPGAQIEHEVMLVPEAVGVEYPLGQAVQVGAPR